MASVSTNELAIMNIEELFTHLLKGANKHHRGPGNEFSVVGRCFRGMRVWWKEQTAGRYYVTVSQAANLDKVSRNRKTLRIRKTLRCFSRFLTDILPSCYVKENVHRCVNQAECSGTSYEHFLVQFVKVSKETVKPEDVNEILLHGVTSLYDQLVVFRAFCDFLARFPLLLTVASRILRLCLDIVGGNSSQL